MKRFAACPALFAATLALAGCGTEPNLSALDGELADVDPAVTAALEDSILVDPGLSQQAEPVSIRPPEAAVQAQYPPGDDPSDPPAPEPSPAEERSRFLPAAAASDGGAAISDTAAAPGPPAIGACGAAFRHGAEWAGRLPPELPLYPGGEVIDAAGGEAGDCWVRFVGFRSAHGWQRVLDWYGRAAERAGFSRVHRQRGEDQVLAGANDGTGATYYLIVTPRGDGSEAALIVSQSG